MAYYIGIDLGGTNIVAGIVDDKYNILFKESVKTNLPRSAEEIVDSMVNTVRKILDCAHLLMEDICWIGVGVPGSVNKESGIIEYANNLEFYNIPLKKMLEEKLNNEVYIENDANAAAFGEYLAGSGRGCNSLIAITLGTGIGGGVVLNRKILTGCNYAAAEIGHFVIKYDGIDCNCGRRGCFEAYASATALIRMTKEAMKKNVNSAMWKMCQEDIETVNGKTVFDAMYMGDKVAIEIIKEYCYYLGVGITNIINIFQPEILCIGGGISEQGDALINPIKSYVEAHHYSLNAVKQTKIVIAELGNDAGIIGAAMLGKE